jgi:hypothetical protein
MKSRSSAQEALEEDVAVMVVADSATATAMVMVGVIITTAMDGIITTMAMDAVGITMDAEETTTRAAMTTDEAAVAMAPTYLLVPKFPSQAAMANSHLSRAGRVEDLHLQDGFLHRHLVGIRRQRSSSMANSVRPGCSNSLAPARTLQGITSTSRIMDRPVVRVLAIKTSVNLGITATIRTMTVDNPAMVVANTEIIQPGLGVKIFWMLY